MSSTAVARVTEETRASLAQRLAALDQLWDLATRDLTLEHVNHFERAGVLPIAFTLLHTITVQDRSRATLFGGTMLWDAHSARVGFAGPLPRRGTPMSVAEQVRVPDMDAWREYQRAVFAATLAAVRDASPGRLAERFTLTPQAFEGGFLALLTGSVDRVRVIDVVEAWILQHGIRHVGELEHARALVGLKGVA